MQDYSSVVICMSLFSAKSKNICHLGYFPILFVIDLSLELTKNVNNQCVIFIKVQAFISGLK